MSTKLLRCFECAVAISVMCFAAGCSRVSNAPFEPERALRDVSGVEVRDFWTRDFGREKRAGGYSALVPEASAKEQLFRLRARLPAGYVSFVGTSRNVDDASVVGVELVLARGTDQFDILRLAATDGMNYGLSTDDIVARVQRWDAQIGVDIWQAESDVVQMDLAKLPGSLSEFSRELYEFCPDIVDQGAGSLEVLEKELRETGAVYLWWD